MDYRYAKNQDAAFKGSMGNLGLKVADRSLNLGSERMCVDWMRKQL